MIAEIALNSIDRQRHDLEKLAQDIWLNPELGFEEVKASKWIAEILEANGFDVQLGIGGMPTAIKASWGEGHPKIGLLGEYDALPGLSQKTQTIREPLVEGAPGHGCGHNLLGVAHMGAAIAVKEEMEAKGLKGTIVYYGCPAEEGGNGKCYMGREGAFDELDVNVHFHPGLCNTIGITGIAICQGKFHFKGVTAHPSSNPQDGRSALDAIELMNVGANYLREHVGKDTSISYIITDGGKAPNMIPDTATVWYSLRANEKEDVEELYEKIKKIAAGAAMMTETTFEEEFLGCAYNPLNNKVLQEVLFEAFDACPAEPYTEEELKYIKEINMANPEITAINRKKYGTSEDAQYQEGIFPLYYNRGSTDVGDVNHICPGVSFRTVCYPLGTQVHSWSTTAMTNHSFAKKGMIRGAKILSYFSIKLLEDLSICERAKAEFLEDTKEKPYKPNLPDAIPKNIF